MKLLFPLIRAYITYFKNNYFTNQKHYLTLLQKILTVID